MLVSLQRLQLLLPSGCCIIWQWSAILFYVYVHLLVGFKYRQISIYIIRVICCCVGSKKAINIILIKANIAWVSRWKVNVIIISWRESVFIVRFNFCYQSCKGRKINIQVVWQFIFLFQNNGNFVVQAFQRCLEYFSQLINCYFIIFLIEVAVKDLPRNASKENDDCISPRFWKRRFSVTFWILNDLYHFNELANVIKEFFVINSIANYVCQLFENDSFACTWIVIQILLENQICKLKVEPFTIVIHSQWVVVSGSKWNAIVVGQ